MHIRIEQNDIQETVSSGIITALSDIASGNVDSTSTLTGTIYAATAYQNPISRINAIFPDLTINVGQFLVYFVDSAEESAIVSVIGATSSGITVEQANLINDVSQQGDSRYVYSVLNAGSGRFGDIVFKSSSIRTLDLTPFRYVRAIPYGNNKISMAYLTTFNGGFLKTFTYWNSQGTPNGGAVAPFNNCTNLKYVTCPNMEVVGTHSFYNTSAQYVFFAKAHYLLGYHFRGNDTKLVYLGNNIKWVSSNAPDWNSATSTRVKLVINKTVSEASECPKIYSSCTVPTQEQYISNACDLSYFETNSTFTEATSLNTGGLRWGSIDIYVPDDCVSIYQQTLWGSLNVYGMSSLSTNDLNYISMFAHENDVIFNS